ncbi:MAG: hypothetical protein WD271_11245 [Acidimicrobiia bacterium]
MWIFKGSGDSGSSGCAPKGQCDVDPDTHFLAVDWPASSPWVTATGGTMVPKNESALTTPGVAWGDPAPGCSGTGGGVSTLYDRPDWQQNIPNGLADPTGNRMVPDVASLAGKPGYELYAPGNPPQPEFSWQPIEGDSMTGPLWAGAMSVVKSALVGRGVMPPVLLNPALYTIASDPTTYATVFHDIMSGSNDLYALGGCSAGPRYDQTTGLGEVVFSELAGSLAFDTLRAVPTFTR